MSNGKDTNSAKKNGCPGFIQDFCPNSAMKNGCPGFQQQAYVQDFIQDLGKLSRAEKMGVQDFIQDLGKLSRAEGGKVQIVIGTAP
jgi:hypothetical protein